MSHRSPSDSRFIPLLRFHSEHEIYNKAFDTGTHLIRGMGILQLMAQYAAKGIISVICALKRAEAAQRPPSI
jgi:hypothetical protein